MIIFICGSRTIKANNPLIGDNFVLDTSIKILKAMDGSIYSTKKTPAQFKHKIVLTNLTRTKIEEFKSFIDYSVAEEIVYIDKDEQQWVGYFMNQEYESETNALGAGLVDTRKEAGTLTLNFEGIKQ